MSKYQEALDNVKDGYSYFDWLDGIKTLQELINQIEMFDDVTNQLEKENAKLEKALDKACDIIAHEGLSFSTYKDSKVEWKEWLLK